MWLCHDGRMSFEPQFHFQNFRIPSRAELIADGVVHVIGILIAIAAGSALLAYAFGHAGPGEYIALIFYLSSLLTVLCVSCAYNLWPHSPVKWVLRRADHAAIYLLIAGTYTPFLVNIQDPLASWTLIGVVWGGALMGMAVKLFLPGRFDGLAVAFYLGIGWSGVMMIRSLADVLPETTIWLIAAGGIAYSSGVIFFVWRSLRFQSALWHGFVVAGATFHLAAMTDFMVVTRL
jgi:hemolysin III